MCFMLKGLEPVASLSPLEDSDLMSGTKLSI